MRKINPYNFLIRYLLPLKALKGGRKILRENIVKKNTGNISEEGGGRGKNLPVQVLFLVKCEYIVLSPITVKFLPSHPLSLPHLPRRSAPS